MHFSNNLIVLFFILASISLTAQQTQKISVHMKSQALNNGTKVEQEANCYFEKNSGKFVMHYLPPNEFVKISNRKGELKMYFPETNKVSIKQNYYFSSENEFLYYFVNNLTEDLGLKREGFHLTSTSFEDGYTINTWKGPEALKSIDRIEMVFEDIRPIYVEYIGTEGEAVKKIYYSEYYQGADFILPMNVTEITYPENQDSVIRRAIFSDLKTNDDVGNTFLNFSIPGDATITQ